MEEERFISGYCRILDAARTVCAVTEQGKLTEADCSYDSCPYKESCSIGQQLTALNG